MYPTTEIRLRSYVEVLLRHKLAIGVVLGITVLVGMTPTLLAEKVYASAGSIRVRSEQVTSPFDDKDVEGAATRSRDLLSDVEVLNSPAMRTEVEAQLEPGVQFIDVEAELVGFSEVIKVTATSHSPQDAADVADVFADIFVQETRQRSVESLVSQAEQLQARVADASDQTAEIDFRLADPEIDPITAENLRTSKMALGAQAIEYTTRADELTVEAALREGRIEVIAYGEVDLSPVAPKPARTAVTSVVIGLLLGIGAAVVLDIARDRITDADSLGELDPSVPLLATVTHIDETVRWQDLPNRVREAYRYLYTSLRFRGVEDPVKCLVVSSALSGEGKTTTALYLAHAAADAGARVVLIDADLRRPAIHERLQLPGDGGLTEVLQGEREFAEAVHYVEPHLAVLPARTSSPISNELLGSPAFAKMIDSVRSQADLVIIDTPPVLPVADPVVVGRLADGLVIVSRIDRVKRREVRSVLRRLRQGNLAILGFVANDATGGSAYDEYGAYESAQ